MKHQLIAIHGGDVFDTYDEYITFLKKQEVDLAYFKKKRWMDSLGDRLGQDFDVITPQMPNEINAHYIEWKIWFEKLVPFLNKEVILLGSSLGGIFLTKYLSENEFSHKILATYFIAAPFDGEGSEYSLGDFALPKSLDGLKKQGGNISLYQSKNDDVVSYRDFEKYRVVLPEAETVIFEDRGHFNQAEFPELVKDLKDAFGTK
jgi:predicted alpha/beta hydrolase family esterase